MSNERLLKRLRHWGKSEREQTGALDAEEYKRSVMSDVSLLYNTQKGTVLIDDDFGVPDFSGMMNRFGEQEAAQIEKALREVTDRYEPRMKGTTVKYIPRSDDQGVLRFVVSGMLLFKSQNIPFVFNALLNGSGSVILEM